jgi:patatin-like phospholipase/acyl hydrolase
VTIRGVDCPLVDGGVVANNPSSLAVALAIKKQLKDDLTAFEASQDLLVLSMGTGNLTKSISVDDARRWGTAQWAFPILDVVFDATSAADEIVTFVCR